ncbi:tetratricopeptide repeat protein [Clostridium sp. FAM 1755]|uniref:tetratricopeptide repeat protein n=1 Tax=Clostridium caseinilyticum TaxID=3350403 RepID=UPI0038F7F053
MQKGNKFRNGFWSKFSVKTKLSIFIILVIVAVFSIYYNNLKQAKNNSINKNTENNISTKLENKAEKNNKDSKINKELEDKCEKGRKLFFDKKYDESIKIEDEVIKEDSNFYKAYNIKGIALCYGGNFEEGMKNIDKSLDIKPDYGYARFNKALAYELYEKFDEALKWYDKALDIEKYEWSYYGKASIYGRRGDVKNTVECLKKAIEISPGVKEEAKHEADFDPVKDSDEFKNLIK